MRGSSTPGPGERSAVVTGISVTAGALCTPMTTESSPPTRHGPSPGPTISAMGAVVVAAVLVLVVMCALLITAVRDRDRPTGYASGELAAEQIPDGWAPLIEEAADQSQVPAPVLAAQIETESAWRTDAVSPVGAQGLSQFMPGTWEQYGRGGDPHDPDHAIDAQGRMMGDLLAAAHASGIDGDPLELALAGYNAGFGAVQEHDGVPPYPETQDYVDRIRDRAPAYEEAAEG